MKITKTKSAPYPRKVTFNNGRVSPVPNQKKFKSDFIKHHGCSMAAFYIALRFCGKKEKMNPLLKWSRSHLKKYMKSKLTIKGVARGLNKKCGRKVATYYKKPTLKRVNDALNHGYLVLMEQGGPIHTLVLYRANGKTYKLDHGNVSKVSTKSVVNKATSNSTYRGLVIVKG